jgi:hypothetical protein
MHLQRIKIIRIKEVIIFLISFYLGNGRNILKAAFTAPTLDSLFYKKQNNIIPTGNQAILKDSTFKKRVIGGIQCDE